MNVVGNVLTGNNSIKRNRVFIRKYCQIVPKSIVIETLFDSNITECNIKLGATNFILFYWLHKLEAYEKDETFRLISLVWFHSLISPNFCSRGILLFVNTQYSIVLLFILYISSNLSYTIQKTRKMEIIMAIRNKQWISFIDLQTIFSCFVRPILCICTCTPRGLSYLNVLIILNRLCLQIFSRCFFINIHR